MPKMDFFSGQPDDAKAAQEDSSASSPQWDDAFAGMQKLDLFEEPAAAGGAAQLTGNVPSAVPGAVQQLLCLLLKRNQKPIKQAEQFLKTCSLLRKRRRT